MGFELCNLRSCKVRAVWPDEGSAALRGIGADPTQTRANRH